MKSVCQCLGIDHLAAAIPRGVDEFKWSVLPIRFRIEVGAQCLDSVASGLCFTFSGFLHEVTDNDNLLGFPYAVGDRFTGWFSYPLDLIDLFPNPEYFQANDSRILYSVTLAGHVFNGDSIGIIARDLSGDNMSLGGADGSSQFISTPFIDLGSNPFRRTVQILFRHARTPLDDMQPTTLSLSDFDRVNLKIEGETAGQAEIFLLNGTIDELSQTVIPEPGT